MADISAKQDVPNCEAVVAVYKNYADKAASLSDRQFTVVAYTVTLNLAIIGALISISRSIQPALRFYMGAGICIFDLLSVIYIALKCRDYWRCHETRAVLEKALLRGVDGAFESQGTGRRPGARPPSVDEILRVPKGKEQVRYWWQLLAAGSGGSLYFVIVILLTMAITLIAIASQKGV